MAIAHISAIQSSSETPAPTIRVDRGDQRRSAPRLTLKASLVETMMATFLMPIPE